jgi:microcystin-dependent protein
MWATSAAPSGWLFLDGATYSQATYPALAAVFGVVSGTFTLPDMRDRFVGGLSVVGALTNNAGTFAPNTANIHTHTTDIAHGHADTIAVNTHGDHTHSVNPAATASGTPSSSGAGQSGSGLTVPSAGHTHSTDIAATTSGAENTNLTHTVTGGVTSLGATSVTSSNGSLTPKSTLLNFIIKA